MKISNSENEVLDTLLLSEKVLSTDWDNPEEDAAWEILKMEKSVNELHCYEYQSRCH